MGRKLERQLSVGDGGFEGASVLVVEEASKGGASVVCANFGGGEISV